MAFVRWLNHDHVTMKRSRQCLGTRLGGATITDKQTDAETRRRRLCDGQFDESFAERSLTRAIDDRTSLIASQL